MKLVSYFEKSSKQFNAHHKLINCEIIAGINNNSCHYYDTFLCEHYIVENKRMFVHKIIKYPTIVCRIHDVNLMTGESGIESCRI